MIRRRLSVNNLERRLVPSSYFEVEPNNLPNLANSVNVEFGDVLTATPDHWLTIHGVIDATTDRDYFAFQLDQLSGVFFDVDSRDVGLSTTLNTVVDVYDATGVVHFGGNNDGYDLDEFSAPTAPVSSALSHDSSVYLDLPSGSYVVRVTSLASNSVGAYRLRMLADTNYSPTTPTLSSRTGAPVSVYLDFDGHSDSDSWGTYSAAAFNLSGSINVFSPGERLAIANAWRVVSEDFAPFDVNVTTVAPPIISDKTGYRIVVTSSSPASLGQAAGIRGNAQFGSFAGAGSNTGFVFPTGIGEYLGGASGWLVANALESGHEASRQFGAALGLRNYGAENSQPTGIMQSPDYGLGRSIWSAGMTHSGEPPVVSQDDVAVITSAINGINYVADDFGNDFATAHVLNQDHVVGLISDKSADRDVFRFNGPLGNVTVRVNVARYFGNLDVAAKVYNLTGELLASSNPATSFDASFPVYLPSANAYYVEVFSHGGPGEIGNYELSLSFAPPSGPVQVVSTIINAGEPQRSMVTEAAIRFSRPVTFPNGVAAAFRLEGPAGLVNLDIDLSLSTPSETTAKLRFPNTNGNFVSLADGRYELSIISTNVRDDSNNFLDGDYDGQPGGNYASPIFRLFGDVDGDRDVDVADFIKFRMAFGSSGMLAFDFDGDGDVDTTDFIQFRQRFGSSV